MLPTANLKHVLQTGGCWWNYYEKHKDSIRPVVVDNIVKMLSCGAHYRGSVFYTCSNKNCTHTKHVHFTCKSRFCPSCGKKATSAWIQKQSNLLPQTPWQHITFTMPSTLWRLFDLNRHLLNALSGLAAKALTSIAKAKQLLIGLFVALHTFGRDLKWNPHLHVSTTTGGLDQHNVWKKLWFKKKALMRAWKYNLLSLLRKHYKNGTLVLPESLRQLYPDYASFTQWLNRLFHKTWIVHCSKPSKSAYHNINYLGRYIKRPPIAHSRLKHYDGNKVVFNFLNHKTKQHNDFHCSAQEFIRRFIQHFPEKGFRLIRYYGFLANRIRSEKLPRVYTALNQPQPAPSLPVRFNYLLKKEMGFDPLECILCKSRLKLAVIWVGKNHDQIKKQHKNLALMRPCYF